MLLFLRTATTDLLCDDILAPIVVDPDADRPRPAPVDSHRLQMTPNPDDFKQLWTTPDQLERIQTIPRDSG